MFPSISKATPLTQRSTSFTANRTITIVPVTLFSITVNGSTPSNPNSVTANAGDTVTATITTPDDWLWKTFYYYTIDGVPQTFAVVNKSFYTIKVKTEDAGKRWYLYETTDHTLSFSNAAGAVSPLVLSNNFNVIPYEVHVVLDPVANSVYFYNNRGIQVSKIVLPSEPIDYVKIPDKQTVVVLVRSGEAYEIFLNSTAQGIAPFYARRNYSEFVDLSYTTRMPGEDLIAYLRRARAKKAIPPATCITYNGMFLLAGGNGTVWIVDPFAQFRLVNTFDIDEYVMNIVALPDNAGMLLVTQSQKIYSMDMVGNATEIYQGTALFQPALFNGKIYIPEGDVGLLKVYNTATNQFEADIPLPDFSPSYTQVDNGKLYVCGHDNEKVLVFDSVMNYVEVAFPEKVTWVSAVDNTIIASHYLKDYKILDLTDLYRIVQIEFRSRSGPVSHVGTNVVKVITLGNSEVFAHTPDQAWLWSNGVRTYSNGTRGTMITDGDLISLNYAIRDPGLSRTNVVIGDVAYDYDVDAVAQTYVPRNIDLPIMRPENGTKHTRTITLPASFRPCLISVEYGTIRVNEAYYYGNFLVGPRDVIKVEIETKGNSALPVLTIGARQFVIPVSTNPANIDPVKFEDSNLAPGTQMVKEIVFTELASLFDYIVPGYYDFVVKKNDVDVTGNYYQQFGVNDRLIVEYLSSLKKYDVTDVYILGPTNYKFTARNSLGVPLAYMDFGNVVMPYTRQLDPYDAGSVPAYIDSTYFWAKEIEVPDIQYTTANITIFGLGANTDANISVVGGDSYFVLDGNITPNINVIVTDGVNVALARNVVSYFDTPISVVQHLPTGDEDGWADVVVGQWGIVNREIVEIKTPEESQSIGIDKNYGIPAGEMITNVDSAHANLNKPSQRAVHASKQKLELEAIVSTVSAELYLEKEHQPLYRAVTQQLDTNNILDATSSTLQLDLNNQSNDNANQLEFDNFSASAVNFGKGTRHVSAIRVLNSSKVNFVEATGTSDQALSIQFQESVGSADRASALELIGTGLRTAESTKVHRADKLGGIGVDGYTSQWLTQPNGTVGTNKMIRMGQAIRTIVSSTTQFEMPIPFVFYDLLTQRSTNTTGITLDSAKVNKTESADSKPDTIYRTQFVQQRELVNSDEPMAPRRSQPRLIVTNADRINRQLQASGTKDITLPDLKAHEYFVGAGPLTQRYNPSAGGLDIIAFRVVGTNLLVSKDATWQGYIVGSSSITPVLATKLMVNYTNTLPTPAEKLGIETYSAEKQPWTTNLSYTMIWDQAGWGKALPGALEVDPSRPVVIYKNYVDTVTSNPVVTGTGTVPMVDMIPLIDHKSETMAKTKEDVTGYGFTIASQPYRAGHVSDTSAVSLPELFRLAPESLVETTIEKSVLAKDIATPMTFAVSKLAHKFADGFEFIPEAVPTVHKQLLDYRAAEQQFIPAFIPWEPLVENNPGVTQTYVKAQVADEVFLSTQYQVGEVSSYNVNTQFGVVAKDYIFGNMSYDRSEPLPITMVVAAWKYSDTSIEPTVIYKLQHQQQDIKSATLKMQFERDRPLVYFTAITLPDIDRGFVWDEDISVEYGAFATEADAILAAQRYTDFRPFLIMDTGLWTYRVNVDTNLVCSLPKGRYPIAWLIRGG